MANPIKWIIEAVAGNAAGDVVIRGITNAWSSLGMGRIVADTATRVIKDAFEHDYSDEEYYNQAWAALEPNERDVLTARVAGLKTDAQRNNFRKAVIQFSWEGPADKPSKKYNPDKTKDVLKAVAAINSSRAWKNFIKANNLHKPPAQKRILVIVAKGRPWFRRAKASYDDWSANQAAPAITNATNQVEAARHDIRSRTTEPPDWAI